MLKLLYAALCCAGWFSSYSVFAAMQSGPQPFSDAHYSRSLAAAPVGHEAATEGISLPPAHGAPQLLRRVIEIRALTQAQASSGIPVQITGVVTEDIPSPDFIIQDATAGIYVEGREVPGQVHPRLGDIVQVTGISGPGHFAPVILEQGLRIVGQGRLPQARLWSFEDIASGQEDSQWGAIRGIVRAVSVDRNSWKEPTLALVIASGGEQFEARVPLPANGSVPENWVDSSVQVEGVCGSIFNDRRQLLGILFYVPRLQFLHMEAPGPALPIPALMRFSPQQGAGHRVRVRGVVSYQQPGHTLFVQDGNEGLRVLSAERKPLDPGDIVDVIGFPTLGESQPVLEDAVYHRVGHTAAPQPVRVGANHLLDISLDGLLAQVEAELLAVNVNSGGKSLLLRSGQLVFSADLSGEGTAQFADLRRGSLLRVQGICLVRSGGLWKLPETVRLLVRERKDIQVLRSPSWWSQQATLWLLGITFSALVVAALGLVFLARKVREQMKVIREKARVSAVLEERHRIARELHDSLEQELTAITLHLDLATARFAERPEEARQALEMARRMSRRSMQEARRSVWDLRCEWLETGDLVSALRKTVQSNQQDSPTVELIFHGEPRRLETAAEMNLLRIGQEAMANAVRHAQANRIVMELDYRCDPVALTISDDGRGFQIPAGMAALSGHFGLLDMRERAQALGCSLHIESRPGRGTRIYVSSETHRRRGYVEATHSGSR